MIGLRQLGDVAIGAVFRAGEKSADTVAELRSRWDQESVRTAGELWAYWILLADRGAAERERGRREAHRVVDAAVEKIAHAPLLDRVIDVQLERVLTVLETEPERIRALVRGQRDSLVGEAVGRVRAGAAAGDEAVDRFTLRMSRRGDTP
ncbi:MULTISPECIES: hypothetical protein [Actinoplanes]|uniref:Uncharacterized protein n=2 Tax=Actinoplanes TaxID=1865 RepID=A0A101JKC4_9ACTN|nr:MULTISPECIES: hypothetical protein [Actinoplanes]KUL27996.1 hypothetical protein ADL15_32835 [Actinoplanes awajinensis subsp. mycoplanecinus]GIE70898.1 hypothetical protein Apa02nite_070060 [Actinoplanes palleronii]